jgi:integrase
LEQRVEADESFGLKAGRFWDVRAETASRVRNRVEAVLDWAGVRGYRSGDNPARWRGHLAEVLPAKGKIQRTTHFAALPFTELPACMVALRERQGIAPRALEFLILTCARTGETISAKWSEIDFAARVWTVPAERMKAGREHRVPLSEPALALLQSAFREADNPFCFIGPTGGHLSDQSMAATLRRMGHGVTVHGFRSTFSDWAHERTAHGSHVIELCLAHSVGNAVERSYRRTDLFEKRRKLMVAWAEYCGRPVAAGEVIPLRAAVT